MENTQTVERRFACMVDDLDRGESMTVPGDINVALFRTESGEFFATADTCTHEEWSLGSDSDLEGEEVVCPLHMARFSVRDGRALCFPATTALTTFGVEIEDDRVYIVR
ncbi:non-heme iron oxygenase ferredoxin subunit [Gordonia aichiensis]|uniref:p-cumate dioxygenase ferredoxin subunit n=1 Tax=Gordonia aichiensis NBRC 108223 TaxID=1220583 RepID=L7KN12_9ACTN|nr:non-heme iron oxygenase ferredoxin subunit [Gordonia aichiensis]GAC49352.1 p-cumate dioxygenase ferredoxin subunit [Gordonia aichiensis NBRC 108223]